VNCGDKGKVYHKGKTIAQITTNDGIDLFEAYCFLKEFKIFPAPGGLIEQSSRFLRCIKWIDMINLTMKDAVQKKQKATAQLARKLNKALGKK